MAHSLETLFTTAAITVALLCFFIFPFQLNFREEREENNVIIKFTRNLLMEEKSYVGIAEPT